jgi:hypothetical protein
MPLTDKDLELFKKWLRSCLKEGNVTVVFTKKDGTERVMKCTTNPTYVMFKDPSLLESKKTRTVNEEVMPVFDVEQNSWKSFRWDSVKSVQIVLGEEIGSADVPQ